jgi:hypothetical protein
VIFANPAGAWALLGLLAVLAIHLLQRRSRRVVIATLFLVDAGAPPVPEGRRLDRLRSSASLWLQLVSVIAVTWLLLSPRFARSESLQRVVVVLDASASLTAFRDPLRGALEQRTAALARAAARTEWLLLDTGLRGGKLYEGSDAAALLRALDAWSSALGDHDVQPAVDVARTLAGGHGLVIFATDHAREIPADIELLAVGSPADNVGFAGVQVEAKQGQALFRAMIKNYGREPALRAFRLHAGGASSPPTAVRVAPSATHVVSGSFPPGHDRVELSIDPDRFALDDRLPLVRPKRKRLRVRVVGGADTSAFAARVLATVDDFERADGAAPADITISGGAPPPPGPAAIVLADTAEHARAPYQRGAIVAENHPLMADLNWQGLLVRAPRPLASDGPDVRVLLRQGGAPLVVLRGGENAQRLVLAFSPRASNAERLPAFPLLLHRFVESVRAGVVGHEQVNVETGQRLPFAIDPRGPGALSLQLSSHGEEAAAVSDPALFRAPGRPGFFRVVQAGQPRITGAAHFADAREADLRKAASQHRTTGHDGRTRIANTREDPLTPLWMLLLATLLVADWRVQARVRSPSP